MSGFQQFIDKLSPYPNDVNRLARMIRFLDKRLQIIQQTLGAQQKRFQAKIKELKQKKITQLPPELKVEYQSILLKQRQMYGYAKQKQDVAGQLLAVINNSYQMVKNDIKNRTKDKPIQEQNMTATKKKKKPIQNTTKSAPKQQQFLYDTVNPRYCSCGNGSYGEMFGCDNKFCQRQWYHFECLGDEKSSAPNENNWICKECKKLAEKFKKTTHIKEFLL